MDHKLGGAVFARGLAEDVHADFASRHVGGGVLADGEFSVLHGIKAAARQSLPLGVGDGDFHGQQGVNDLVVCIADGGKNLVFSPHGKSAVWTPPP